MKAKRTTKKEVSDVIDFISGFETGDFSKQLGQTDDPILQPIIDKLNTAAKVLAAQADTSLIIDSLGIGIWKWDLITNDLVWDRNMYHLYGADPTDFSGAYDAWENSLTDDAKAKAIEELNIAIAGGKSFDTTFQVVQRSTGNIQEIRTRAFIIGDENGKPFKMWGINIDRTRESELEIELKNAHVNAVRNSQLASLGVMTSGIAHEINNPLTIILGMVNLLPDLIDKTEEFQSHIHIIKNTCYRISRIVNSLKKFSRSGEKLAIHKHELCSIIKEAVNLVDIKSKQCSTPITVDYRTHAHILCDEIQIEQVVINLVNNAIDAVNTKSEKWIKVSVFEDQDSVVLQVIDSGHGIPENIRNKLFVPFFTTKNIDEGTGLGLSITKGILDEHKATITVVANCPNTCFEIRFPKADEIKNAE